MNNLSKYNLIIVGSGAAGMISAISAAKKGNKILLLEKLPKLGSKLKATGGGKCNLTNKLENSTFMEHFGKNGRFMQDALKEFDSHRLIEFFKEIGVTTHAPDGVRVFPTTHNSQTILQALIDELKRLEVEIKTEQKVIDIEVKDGEVIGVVTEDEKYSCSHVIIATGGLGYPTLGAQGDGYALASKLGHKITKLYPAMMPLSVKEKWVTNCRADTIAKATTKINLKKYKNLKANGDLIFTKDGIRGPVVLDFSREITPLFDKYDEIPLLVNLTKGLNQDEIISHIKSYPTLTILESVSKLLPKSVSLELLNLCEIAQDEKFKTIHGKKKDKLIDILTWTPLTVTGHEGFSKAMITRGGVSLKEINPKTMQSKLVKGLYFCGEVMDLDGPCGGYNLQWSFSSGYLAGKLRF